jgi:hypothetical protein
MHDRDFDEHVSKSATAKYIDYREFGPERIQRHPEHTLA